MASNLEEAERRIAEAKSLQSKSLDLGDLALKELPASLGDLPHLRTLSLGMHRLTETGGREWDEPWLQPKFTNLAPIARLQGLRILDFAGCEGVADLSSLADLKGLQSLDLSKTGVTELLSLAGFQGLQNLCLDGAGITDLLPLADLQGLQSLYLSGTGVTDLSPLAGLQELQNLYLDGADITDLSPLADLQGLQSLYLSGTGVTDLSPLAGFRGLQSLGLNRAGVMDLSPLIGLQGLQVLYLHGCRPTIPAPIFRALADHPRLTTLAADEAIGVPREVLSHKVYDNCLPRLRTYFSELHLGSEAEKEVKVILLGNGRVGKTQLCRRFRGQAFDDAIESTHGVKIWREELRLRTGGEEQIST